MIQPLDLTILDLQTNAIRIMQTIMNGLPQRDGSPWIDGLGTPFTIPVAAEYAEDDALYPRVVLTLETGDMATGIGDNILDQDVTTGIANHAIMANNSAINLDIRAHSDNERRYLAAVFVNDILTAAGENPTTNTIEEQAIIMQLRRTGMFLQRIKRPNFPKSVLQGPRPDSQIYQAVVRVIVDINFAWTTPLQPANAMELDVESTLTEAITLSQAPDGSLLVTETGPITQTETYSVT